MLLNSLSRTETILLIGLVLVTGMSGGCTNLGYYLQSVSGHMDIVGRKQPIQALLEDANTAAALKNKLAAALKIREFASRELGLPDNGSYRHYADLQRPYAVWNVFATTEFSIRPKEWCLAFAGCVAYRGYFSKAEAEQFAANLRSQGHDVFVSGVPAYSTLGWFNDPVLNTFVNYPETEIARLIFHELAHQVVYVRDDTMFNESFAVAVEIEGLSRWLDKNGSPADKAAHNLVEQRKNTFISLVLKYREKLAQLYSRNLSDEEKRQSKARIFGELREEYAKLKTGWGGYSGFDRWFAQEPNNATLASVAAYTQLVPVFQTLLERHRGDLPGFYSAVKEIAKLSKHERAARLAELAGAAQ